jgi:hypothetical protein
LKSAKVGHCARRARDAVENFLRCESIFRRRKRVPQDRLRHADSAPLGVEGRRGSGQRRCIGTSPLPAEYVRTESGVTEIETLLFGCSTRREEIDRSIALKRTSIEVLLRKSSSSSAAAEDVDRTAHHAASECALDALANKTLPVRAGVIERTALGHVLPARFLERLREFLYHALGHSAPGNACRQRSALGNRLTGSVVQHPPSRVGGVDRNSPTPRNQGLRRLQTVALRKTAPDHPDTPGEEAGRA